MKILQFLIVALFIVVASRGVRAHHSGSEYDVDNIVEIEGTLIELKWQNPHVRLLVRAPAPAGEGAGQGAGDGVGDRRQPP